MDTIKSSVDKIDLLEKLCKRAEKESLKTLLEEIKTDIQLLDVLLLGLRSVSTAPDYSAVHSGLSVPSSPDCFTIPRLRTWEVKIESGHSFRSKITTQDLIDLFKSPPTSDTGKRHKLTLIQNIEKIKYYFIRYEKILEEVADKID